jgi:hypothetical protein
MIRERLCNLELACCELVNETRHIGLDLGF